MRCSGTRSSSSASICVSGFASRRPGVGSMVAWVPMLITTRFPWSTRTAPSADLTSIVLGLIKRPVPITSSCTAGLIIIEMHIHEAGHHSPFPFPHGGHVDFPVAFDDPEFLASSEVRRNHGAVDDVLARKAGDVRAGASNIFPFNHHRLHPLFGQSPGEEFAGRSAAQNEQVVFLRLSSAGRAGGFGVIQLPR